MSARRDLFVLVAAPGRELEAEKTLSSWLREIEGHAGYLGGAVLKERAGELLPNTMVLALDFESTDAARAFWPTIEGSDQLNPIYPDDRDSKLPDQGRAFFEGESADAASLRFDRAGGLSARMLHVHAQVLDEHRTATVEEAAR